MSNLERSTNSIKSDFERDFRHAFNNALDGLDKEMFSLNSEMHEVMVRTAPIVNGLIEFVKSTMDVALDAGLTINEIGFDQWTGTAMSGVRKCVATSKGIDLLMGNEVVGLDAVKDAPSLAIPWIHMGVVDYKNEKISVYLGNPYNSVKFSTSSYRSVNQFTVLYEGSDQGHKLSRWGAYVNEHKQAKDADPVAYVKTNSNELSIG